MTNEEYQDLDGAICPVCGFGNGIQKDSAVDHNDLTIEVCNT